MPDVVEGADRGPVRADPRLARSRDRIVAVATELLRECGSTGLTIEAVAARSGIAKTTIYRQFADRDELHLAVMHAIAPTEQIPDRGDVVADVRCWLHTFADRLRAERGVLPSMIEAAERSAHVDDLARDFGTERRQVIERRLQRAIRDGELAPQVDVEVLVGVLVGPLFYRRYISRQAIGRGFVDRLVDAALAPIVAGRPEGR